MARRQLGATESNSKDATTKGYVDALVATHAFAALTAAATLAADTTYLVDATSAGFTLTLPTSPANRSVIELTRIDTASANTVNIAPGGTNTLSGTSPYVLRPGMAITVIYRNSTGTWHLLSNLVGGMSGIDGPTSSPTGNTLMVRDSNGRTQNADPASAQDSATKAYVDRVPRYKGAWSAASDYHSGDIVIQNDRMYQANTDLSSAAPTQTYVGSSGATNTTAKTTTTTVALPTGSVAGDYILISMALHNVPASSTVATDLTAPAYATVLQRQAISGFTNTMCGVAALCSYKLVAADITAGQLVMPTQSAANNAAGSYLDVVLTNIRGANSIAASTVSAVTTGTGTPVSRASTAFAAGSASFTLWFLATNYNSLTSSAPTFSPAATVGTFTQQAGGNNRGSAVVGVGSGGIAAAETLGITISSASVTWGAQVLAAEATYVNVFDSSQWTLIPELIPPGVVHMYAAAWNAIPEGWLLCDGTIYNIVTYPDLGAALVGIYGGDGSTTFAVPNFASKVPRGVWPITAINNTGGSDSHTHADTFVAPAHTHTTGAHTHDLLDTVGFAEVDVTTGGTILIKRQAPAFTYSQTAGGTAAAASSGTANASAGLTGRTSSITSGASASGSASSTTMTGAVSSTTQVPAYTALAFIIKT